MDREVQRETRVYLLKIKALGSGKGNGHTNGDAKKAAKRRNVPRGTPSPQRVLHGRYLGLTRLMGAGNKAHLSALYKEKGVRAAIREAKRIAASAS